MGRILSPVKNTPDHDLVYTPRPLALDIIDHFNPKGIVLDPCKGDGAFYDQFYGDEKLWCEIQEGVDFFEFNRNDVDWIITNPPWSKIKDFLRHGMKISYNIVYLVTINHLMTKARMRMIYENNFGFREIYGVKTPKTNTWPQSGFQLAAIHLQRNYNDKTLFSGCFGE